MADLPNFDGRDVLSSTIKVTNAGDGLSEALKVDPSEFHIGEKVYVVLETEVSAVDHRPIKDTDALQRIHTLKASGATIVDEELVRAQLDAQLQKIEAAKGIKRLDFDEDEDDAEDGD